jgi:hypothetical protein
MAGRWRWTMTLLAGGLLSAGACNKWVVHPVPTPPAPMRTINGVTRVTLSDQRILELTKVVIATDSLFGLSAFLDSSRHALPLRDVRKIEQQVKNPTQTLITMGIVGFLLLGFTDIFGAALFK